MCCETHALRDFLETARGRDVPEAPDGQHRCRCSELGKWPGLACPRYADGEDILCPWCRETDHMAWYNATLRLGDPAVSEYYRGTGAPMPGTVMAGDFGPVEVYWDASRWKADGDTAAGYTAGGADPYGNRIAAVSAQLQVSPEGLRELTDLKFTPGEPRPFEMPPETVARLRGEGPFAGMLEGMKTELSTEDVMKYIRGKYGA